MSQIDLKIGPKIKGFRRQLGIQANKLAEKLNISPSYLTLIEGGKRRIDADLLMFDGVDVSPELSMQSRVALSHEEKPSNSARTTFHV